MDDKKSGGRRFSNNAALVWHCLLGQCAQSSLSADTAAADDASNKQDALNEIIVTGTWIRGVAPVGTNVIDLSAQDIEATAPPPPRSSCRKFRSSVRSIRCSFPQPPATPTHRQPPEPARVAGQHHRRRFHHAGFDGRPPYGRYGGDLDDAGSQRHTAWGYRARRHRSRRRIRDLWLRRRGRRQSTS